MGEGRPHYQLDAWKIAMDLVTRVYELTRGFPAEERYGLASQMRRAAVSVPSNIAEGAARGGRKEFAQFLHIARGSLSELETQLMIAVRLNYMMKDDAAFALLEHVSRLVSGLLNKVKS